jgi:phosphomannomutase
MASQDFASRPIKKLVLFDVDGTLTPARQVRLLTVFVSATFKWQQSVSLEMLELLKELRKKVAIGFVGGSDLVKITEQLTVTVVRNNSECEVPVPRAYDSIVELGS